MHDVFDGNDIIGGCMTKDGLLAVFLIETRDGFHFRRRLLRPLFYLLG